MNILIIVGIILAILNPVIGGVLVGYLVWLRNPVIGIQLIVLSLTVFSLFVIGFMVWAGKKVQKLERRLSAIEGKK